jgi:hypothetical protein
MRKRSETRFSNIGRHALDADLRNTRPLRVPGATITAWSDGLETGPDVFFSQPILGTTVAGSGSVNPAADGDSPIGARSGMAKYNRSDSVTVSMSDGTQITFATAIQSGSAD